MLGTSCIGESLSVQKSGTEARCGHVTSIIVRKVLLKPFGRMKEGAASTIGAEKEHRLVGVGECWP